MANIITEEVIATYEDTQEIRDAVFERVLKYFEDEQMFWGEAIHQSDDAILNAPGVMSDICDDILKFKVTDRDE